MVQLFLGVGRKLYNKKACRFALDKKAIFLLSAILSAQFQDMPINQFYGIRTMTQANQIGPITLFERIAMHTQGHFPSRRERVQIDLNLGNKRQSPFAATKQFTKIYRAFFPRTRMICQILYHLVNGITTATATDCA